MSILLLCAFLGITHLVSTLSYGVRIAGARTGKIAFCLSLFNLLVLVSRSANTLLTPSLSKRVESQLDGSAATLAGDFHALITASSVATLIGIVAIPSFQRYISAMVSAFDRFPSIGRLTFHAFSPAGWLAMREAWSLPSRDNLSFLSPEKRLPWGIFLLNVGGSALLTTGVLSSLYAGVYAPELRMTTGQLSAVVNFLGTILLFAFVDPYLSYITDSAAAGSTDTDSKLRAAVLGMGVSRLIGTVLAHALLTPGARLIAWIAHLIPG
ncbi:lipid II flippase family protein [Haloferula sargassicola]|uniref:Lipid II flippase Amj n=1 Tax=Haloferula sargassicola TaxID=490096 RepID=A0ABP9UIZ7_9BACT